MTLLAKEVCCAQAPHFRGKYGAGNPMVSVSSSGFDKSVFGVLWYVGDLARLEATRCAAVTEPNSKICGMLYETV